MASIWDRDVQRRFAFPGAVLSVGMIRQNLGTTYFAEARERLPIVLMMYARGRCYLEGWRPNTSALTLCAMEMIGPNIAEARFLDAAAARKMFVEAILRFLIEETYDNNYCSGRPANIAQVAIAGVEDNVVNIVRRCPAALPATATALFGILVEDQNRVLDQVTAIEADAIAWMANLLCLNPSARARALGTNMYALVYISLAKRGNISPQKLNSVAQAITEETNMAVTISAEDIKVCNRNLGPYVTHLNAQNVMDTLRQNMVDFSLRLTITVQQSVRCGMTSYWCIRTAVSLFGNFPWPALSALIPDDFVAFNVAVRLVGNNEYYGFNPDLGNAAHTKYKSLAWTAIQLLIRFRAAQYGSLANYAGRGRPDRQVEIDALIEAYVPPVNEEVAGVAEMVTAWRLAPANAPNAGN